MINLFLMSCKTANLLCLCGFAQGYKRKRKEVIFVNKFKRLLAEMIQKLAKHTAILACGAASAYGGYQTKEPKNIYQK